MAARRKNSFALNMGVLATVLTLVFILSGCMKLKDQHVNTELFEGKQDMQTRVSELKAGMSKKDVFTALNISEEKFNRLSLQDIQTALYGNSQMQGTPEQLEKFRRQLLRYDGYSLPYRSIESEGSLGFAKFKIHKKGHDLVLIMIFHDGKLAQATIQGKQEVDEMEDQYLWNTILRTGVSAAM
ncbi:MAG: hypothetical protein EP349_03260 [Alphaproteobacteria bacterium]|nr:MAG: hypothetical protein EP349_03260 [Alphaproteobacteria bacterium]